MSDVQSFLLPKSLDALLITNPLHIRYLTGFSGASPTEREAFLLILQDSWHLITFGLYEEEANTVAKQFTHITIHLLSGTVVLGSTLSTILTNAVCHNVGFEPRSMTVAEHQLLSKACPTITLVATDGLVEEKRVKKTPQEISTLKKACSLTDSCFEHIQKIISKGITEKQVAWEIEKYFKEHDAENSFAPIVAFNEHSAIPHHQPGTTTLSPNSLILVDFGAKVHGYHADMTRILFFGKPSESMLKAYTTILTAQQNALEYLGHELKPSGSKADEIARETIEKAGYPLPPHSLGHGVGLEIHENPRLSINRVQQLEPNMVFSVEPGTYSTGTFGIRIEDLVLKTQEGIELLSKASKEIICL